jgi:cytoskeletal protein CcmA (bactofilin family)
MGATYTRQSSSGITDGAVIEASDLNAEFDQLLATFVAASGHTHDGTAAEGGPVTKLLGTAITIGDGTSGTDIAVTFDGETGDGVLTWMEDEDYFKFSDEVLMNSTEKLLFGDTGTYIHQSADGVLDLVSDTEIEINATTIDINGAVAMDGAITGATNITLSGELDAATGDFSGNVDIDGTLEADAITINSTAIGSIYGVIAGSSSIVTTGALDSGSITSGFGTIDTGSSTITTTGLISGGSLDIDNVLINGTTIGHTDDTDLMTVADGVLTVAGELDATTLDISGNADIDGITNLDAVDIDGAVQIDGTTTVGVDGTGLDVKFFGDTSGSFLLWDQSDDALELTDSSPIKIGDGGDMQVYHDGTNSYITNSQGALKVATESSGIAVTIGHSTSEVTIADNLTVTGTLTLGSGAELEEAELEFLDGITAGTAAASKAMVLDASADITGGRNLTISGELDAATLDISGNADIDGTTNLDAVDIDGAVQIDAAFTSGVDGQGYDTKFFGDTSSAYMLWDTSADDLVFAGAAGIDLAGDIDVDGTANLDIVDIDVSLDANGTIKLDGSYPTGDRNVALGNTALDSVEGGAIGNTCIGNASGTAVTTGDLNTAIGFDTLLAVTTAVNNTALGYNTLKKTTGAYNVAVGANALVENIGGAANIALGNTAGNNITTGSGNVVIGVADVSSATGDDQFSISDGEDGSVVWMTGDNAAKLTFPGALQVSGAVTVGVDDTGLDVKFFGASAGAYMEWDESADQLRIMGASADATTSTGKLLLATSLTDINANDVIGKVDFQAPHEAGGTDAITVAASIQALAQATFSSSVNATDLIFYTGHSEAATEKFRFTSQGELGVGGANYGTDGQILTSAGAGVAPAWEDAAEGGISMGKAIAAALVFG